MSMLGILDGVCLLWGGTTFNGFSTATAAMIKMGMIFGLGEFLIAREFEMLQRTAEAGGIVPEELSKTRSTLTVSWQHQHCISY